MRDNAGYRLNEAIPTLAGELSRHGYATGGFVSSYVLRDWTGIGRGFDVYDDGVRFETGRQLGELQRPGAETLAAAIDWLGGVADAPFFLFLHLYEPHAPYQPPPPFAGLYEDAYDGEVAAADAVVGQLIERLEELGRYNDAMVILLSDHGEGLMDHDEMDHLILIYREVLQVPLIVKPPGRERAGERVTLGAQLSDVAPTVYSLAGLAPPDRLAGVDLLGPEMQPSGAGPRRIVSESVYPRIHFGWSDLASIVEGDLHFIESPEPELFRLSEDPGERSNVIQEERAAARRLRAALAEIDRTLTSPAEEDPETQQRLKSLGYLSGGTRAGADGDLADPKSRIGIVVDLDRASRSIAAGKLAEAESMLRAVLASEPQLVVVHGRSWVRFSKRRGEVLEQALDAYRRGFEASGGDAVGRRQSRPRRLLLRVGQGRRSAGARADGRRTVRLWRTKCLAQAALIEGNDLDEAGKVPGSRRLRIAVCDLSPLIVEDCLAESPRAASKKSWRSERRGAGRVRWP